MNYNHEQHEQNMRAINYGGMAACASGFLSMGTCFLLVAAEYSQEFSFGMGLISYPIYTLGVFFLLRGLFGK